MARSAPRVEVAAAVLATAALLTAGPSPAEKAAPAPGPEATPAEAPPAPATPPSFVPIADVIERATATEQETRESRSQARPSAQLEELAASLKDRRAQIEAEVARAEERIAGTPPLERLSDIEGRWRRERTRLVSALERATARARELDILLARLDELGGLWERTEAQVGENDVPESVAARIAATRGAIADARAEVAAERADVLELQTHLSSLETAAGRVVEQAASARESAREDLLHASAPPLWTELASARLDGDWREDMRVERVLDDPAPSALFSGFGESSLDFTMRAWTTEFDDWLEALSGLNVAVNRALEEAGIEIPFPRRDLHVRSIDIEDG